VDARLFDVLHHSGDVRVLAVAERVDVQLERLLEEAVEQESPRGARHGARTSLVVRNRRASHVHTSS
jgi:hypothetical protein